LTAVPLGIAFILGRRAANRRFTYGYGRAEDLAGLVIVLTIAASAAFAARRPSMKAMPSGTAVSASAALCTVSPSSATEPETATTPACARAVAPSTASETHRARMPWAEDSSAASSLSAVSWECGVRRWARRWRRDEVPCRCGPWW
ncbi:cation transporter, partial [Streptomyces murinus]|uniref:cation transporter n=1 Tax=Streptomyces murinus TaxID=33900 RepID=UPI003134536E